MGFMEPEIVFGQWYEVETDNGTDFVPADVVGVLPIVKGEVVVHDHAQWEEIYTAVRPYCDGKLLEVTLREGYGARLSAPGYLDCTEWSVFETEEEAEAHLEEMGGDDDEE